MTLILITDRSIWKVGEEFQVDWVLKIETKRIGTPHKIHCTNQKTVNQGEKKMEKICGC